MRRLTGRLLKNLEATCSTMNCEKKPAPRWDRRLAVDDLIKRLRYEADISDRPGQMDRLNALADEFAAALEAARVDSTSTATSPDQILIDAIEREIRQLEGKDSWLPQATRIAKLRAAIDQARGKEVQS